MIALSWAAGAGADETATLVNITSRRLNVPNATSALLRITLKSKPKCFFLLASILLAGSKYVSWIHLTSSRFVLTLGFKQTPDFITIEGKIGFLNCGEVLKGENGPLELFCQLLSIP